VCAFVRNVLTYRPTRVRACVHARMEAFCYRLAVDCSIFFSVTLSQIPVSDILEMLSVLLTVLHDMTRPVAPSQIALSFSIVTNERQNISYRAATQQQNLRRHCCASIYF